jgi:hypothetical protein
MPGGVRSWPWAYSLFHQATKPGLNMTWQLLWQMAGVVQTAKWVPGRPIFPSLVFHIIRTSQAIAPFMARYGQANSVCVCFTYRQMVLPWDVDDLWRTPCHYRSLQKRTTMGRLWVASPNKNLKGFSELMHLMPCFHAWKCIHLVHLSIKWYHYFRWFWICHDAEDSKALKGLQGTIFQTGMDIMDITWPSKKATHVNGDNFDIQWS